MLSLGFRALESRFVLRATAMKTSLFSPKTQVASVQASPGFLASDLDTDLHLL